MHKLFGGPQSIAQQRRSLELKETRTKFVVLIVQMKDKRSKGNRLQMCVCECAGGAGGVGVRCVCVGGGGYWYHIYFTDTLLFFKMMITISCFEM